MVQEKLARIRQQLRLVLILRITRFGDSGEALNVLSSHGWHVEQVWTTEDRTGTVVNYLISLEVEKLLPVYPWRDKSESGKGAVGKDAGGKGAGKAPGKSR